MAKLYPPVIEGTIPAFSGTELTVPFSMNRAVSQADISGFSLKIKTVQSNTFVKTIVASSFNSYQAIFNISNANLVDGQYYKLQLAYIDTMGAIGYYSTVGVVKYYGINAPIINIRDLSTRNTNIFTGNYIGYFNHENDPTEKVAYYNFIIYDVNENIVYNTGKLLHNVIDDLSSVESIDQFKYLDELDNEKTYYLQYNVITSNNMECSSPKYRIITRNNVGGNLNINIIAKNNYDNGYVELNLNGLTSSGQEKLLSGSFEIARRNIANPKHWEKLFEFILQNEPASKSTWRDFTVCQGVTYEYSVRQFNNAGVYSDRSFSNQVYVDFEDAFLFDGQRQLKIKYNPKVSSFKNDILESKTDTIGSKYPFIFRNGHVNYKEFPISGLISYWSDNEELFIPLDKIGIIDITNWSRNETNSNDTNIGEKKIQNSEEKDIYNTEYEYLIKSKTTDLVNYNIAAERQFKLEVLEWLTNGKPKLFRSPSEGNYIVRLLNTNLTPNDTVGRMLHTFQCIAYEVADMNYENLSSFGFINTELNENDKIKLFYRGIQLRDIIKGNNNPYIANNGYIELLTDPYSGNILTAESIYFSDMLAGDIVYINDKPYIIGATGEYRVEIGPIYSVKVQAVPETTEDDIAYDYQGNFIYSYKDMFKNSLDLITKLTINEVPCHQFLGQESTANLVEELLDIRTEILEIAQLQAELRPVEFIYLLDDEVTIEDGKEIPWEQVCDMFSFDRIRSINNEIETEQNRTGNSMRERLGSRFQLLKNPIYMYNIKKAQDQNVDPDNENVEYVYVYKTDEKGNIIWDVKEKIAVTWDKKGMYFIDNNFNKYYDLDSGDYYLSYNQNTEMFKIEKNYSTKIYVNTGITTGVKYSEDGELCDANGDILQPYADLAIIQELKTTVIPKLTDIYAGNGIIVNLSYLGRTINYIIDNSNQEVKELKKEWERARNEYLSLYYTIEGDKYVFNNNNWKPITLEKINEAKEKAENANEIYNAYIEKLELAVEKYKKDNNIE